MASDLMELADFHEQAGVRHAKAASSKEPWHNEQQASHKTRRAADHFAVAAALRALASKEPT